jgi:hypothetical protein
MTQAQSALLFSLNRLRSAALGVVAQTRMAEQELRATPTSRAVEDSAMALLHALQTALPIPSRAEVFVSPADVSPSQTTG